MTAGFTESMAIKHELEAIHAKASANLKRFPRLPNGMTPDNVKETEEWQDAKREYDAAHANLRAFNASFTRQFAKEYGKYMRSRRNA